jgi:outer membrane protein assembly factor BamB
VVTSLASGGVMKKFWWLAAATISVLLTGMLGAGAAAGQPFVNWTQYLYSPGHTSDDQAATTITPANAAQLKSVWRFVPSAASVSGLGGFFASPVVYNGVIYIGARNGYFYAIDETTGKMVWRRFIGIVTHKTCGAEGFTATATVAPDPTTGNPTIYAYGATGFLYAMNTFDGTNVWPPAAVAIPSTTKNDYYAWSSPLVAGGNIYVGISSQCDNPLVRGALDAFSQATGTLENTFFTTPAGTRGASIWSSPASDGSAVYITTGNGPKTSKGFSIIKLDPTLTQQLDIWTVPAASRITDSDFGGSPGIWTATFGGTPTELVGACNKNGVFYALRAANLSAGPVWSLRIGNPDTVGPGQCDAAPIFDGTHLYLASNGTTINGTSFDGSVREVDPATGAVVWQTGLTGSVIGTPGMDGSGVIAAATYGSTTGQNGVFLIDAATGRILKTLQYATSKTFGQPVFADGDLIVASTGRALQAYQAG